MKIRICPECGKAFYALSDVDTLVCRYCGFVLFDRRVLSRTAASIDSKLKLSGHITRVRLKDYSRTGARIIFEGKHISDDTVLNLVIDELNIDGTAKTVWSKKVAKNTYSYGLHFFR